MKNIIAINCTNSNEEDINKIQTLLFDNGYCWCSCKSKSERKYKNIIDVLILEDDNMFSAHENILLNIDNSLKIIRFNSPIEYIRTFKIKRTIRNVLWQLYIHSETL